MALLNKLHSFPKRLLTVFIDAEPLCTEHTADFVWIKTWTPRGPGFRSWYLCDDKWLTGSHVLPESLACVSENITETCNAAINKCPCLLLPASLSRSGLPLSSHVFAVWNICNEPCTTSKLCFCLTFADVTSHLRQGDAVKEYLCVCCSLLLMVRPRPLLTHSIA